MQIIFTPCLHFGQYLTVKSHHFSFQTVTKTMPESNIHRGDEEFGGCQNHSYYHNVQSLA